ncbi:hypothetical protein Tco_0909484 [Tanacetum coccineum]|uniref:RNA-directed DNA polymerase, eukaryota, reverse transcriptase zinc-binding domain protein n=1 Tax=Tanacetum coccineum TaxID=301880 RepID=A0ABQ5CR56_9ASTR
MNIQNDTLESHNDEWKSFQCRHQIALCKYGKSSASALEDPTLRARNPIKEILLKLNLPDHRFKRWCDVQSAFVSNRQILDGPFILNELLSWCKHKKFKAMVFKVDFEKIFDSIRWDYLQDILKMFGFGDKWCGLFLGIPIDSSLTLSHLFFADDDIFVGKWDSLNIRTIVNVLKCFHLASGLKINFHKSKLMGIGTRSEEVEAAAITMGCSIFTTPFVHLGVKVRVPSGMLKLLKLIRRNLFNEVDGSKRKMAWISWNKVLASKKYGGLVVSSLYALNRVLLLKWVWRFFSHGSCLWTRFIKAIYGEDGALNSPSSLSKRSPWLDIIREVIVLRTKGINLLDLIRKKIGIGLHTLFWEDIWLDDLTLKHKFPRLYALDNYKQITVFEKINHVSMVDTFCRPPRGGTEEEQLEFLLFRIDGLILTNIPDR